MEYRSPRTLSRLAIAGLGVSGLCHLLEMILGIAQVAVGSRTVALPSGQVMNVWLLTQGLIAIVVFIAYVFTVVTFLMWLFRIYKNLPFVLSETAEFTPGWAVGWWFIPLANLIKPFQAVRDAWLENDPQVETEASFLKNVKGGAPSFLVVWWVFWIASNIVSNITGRLMSPAELNGYVFAVEGILWTAAASLAIKVVNDVTNRQESRIAVVGHLNMLSQPPPPPSFDSVGEIRESP